MAIRVTGEDVKKIIDTDLSESEIEIFIETASDLVDDLIGIYAAARLEKIELWLSAHFLAMSLEPQPQSEAAGQTSVTYQGQSAMRLDATRYGQMVGMLDTQGALSDAGKPSASFVVTDVLD